jgi:hypothetical protein
MRGENTRALRDSARSFFLQQRDSFTPLTPWPPLRKGEGECA